MNVRKASFDNVPQEVLMKILIPFCDLRSLKELSKVNPEWNLAVRRFMKEFNKVVILTVNSHSRDLLHFVAQQTTKLVKLNVIWNTDLKSDKNALVKIIQSNKALNKINIDADVDNDVKLPFEFISMILDAIEVIKPDFNRNFDYLRMEGKSIDHRLKLHYSGELHYNLARVSVCFNDTYFFFLRSEPIFDEETDFYNDYDESSDYDESDDDDESDDALAEA